MSDHLAHLQHPAVVAAEAAWRAHVFGTDDTPGCQECLTAASQRTACATGVNLHEEWVLAAHAAHREARG